MKKQRKRRRKIFCTNCGKELPDTEKVCPYCGIEKMDIRGFETESGQNKTGENIKIGTAETTTWSDKLLEYVGSVCAVFLIIGLYIGAKNWIQDHYGQYKLYTAIYDSAMEEEEELFYGASNLKIGGYDKDNIVFQKFDYYDFGYGRLRYARYAVSVPTEWDAVYEHMSENVTINVFYYTSNQNVSDGVDTSVPAHIHREDVSQELEDLFEGLRNLGNYDDWD